MRTVVSSIGSSGLLHAVVVWPRFTQAPDSAWKAPINSTSLPCAALLPVLRSHECSPYGDHGVENGDVGARAPLPPRAAVGA